MIDPETLHEEYEAGAREHENLKSRITKKEASDIANLFVHIMPCFCIKEPYLTDRKNMVLNFLGIKNEDLVHNTNIEEIRKRLSLDYSIFGKVSSLFCACCLSGGDSISIFQRFIYRDEYENFIKYRK